MFLEKYAGKGKEGDFFGEMWKHLTTQIASERKVDFQIQPSLLVYFQPDEDKQP